MMHTGCCAHAFGQEHEYI